MHSTDLFYNDSLFRIEITEGELMKIKDVSELTQEIVSELLQYNKETGELRWKHRSLEWFRHCKLPERQQGTWNTRYAGKLAGRKWVREDGYSKIYVAVLGKRVLAHRLIWLLVTGAWPDGHIDHVNNNSLDNRWSNLRVVTGGQNSRNLSKSRANTSGVTGVSKTPRGGDKWRARVKFEGKEYHLGCFEDIKDAEAAVEEFYKKRGFSATHGKQLAPYAR